MEIFDLGVVDYERARIFQQEAFKRADCGDFDCALVVCSHFPVITLGRAAKKESILVPERLLAEKKIPLIKVERGGGVTYHGPGQLTVYPVINLRFFKKDIHWYLRKLEESIIAALSEFGVAGSRRPGATGVWVGRDKIASVGISVKRWIGFHGLTINVKKNDLQNFAFIHPCGMDIQMTSLETLLNKQIVIEEVKRVFIKCFQDVFSINVRVLPFAATVSRAHARLKEAPG